MFARRTEWELGKNPLTLAIDRFRLDNRELLDLTSSNPTACGIAYDEAAILRALSKPESLSYDPQVFGSLRAREVIASLYALDPERMMLTASTSEAYSYLFRLSCDAGDEVLVPRPSYPLFEMLAQVNDVVLRGYDLFYDHGWFIDFASLRAAISSRTRAVILVNPNNPTGSYLSETQARELEELCEHHRLAVISDEVFFEYALSEEADRVSWAQRHRVLGFTMAGLSKTAALPQMKLAWTAVHGPSALVTDALARLEVIADTFLSVSAPVQHGIAELLATAPEMQGKIRERCFANLTILRETCAVSPVTPLRTDGGWSAVLRIPSLGSDEDFAIQLLEQHGVLVHPGHFYDFRREGYVVVSLLTPTETLREGTRRLIQSIP